MKPRFGALTMLRSLLMLLACSAPLAAQGQGRDAEVLRVPWIDTEGFAILGPSGEPAGFYPDLARAIAREAGFEIAFVGFDAPSEVRQALLNGEADMLAGVGRWFDPGGQLLFSDPVAETHLLLYVRSDNTATRTDQLLSGRIGTTRDPDAVGIALPEGGRYVFYEDIKSLFAGLLFDEVDAAMLMSSVGERMLRTTGLETLVSPALPALRTQQHHVVLRTEFDDLMPRIDAAIARLKADGRLNDLARRYYMVAPVQPPDVLTVGVVHFPPYYVIGQDGTFGGFGVEVLRALAERAGVALRFEAVSMESWAQGPRVGSFDLLPVRSVTDAEREIMDFTAPVQTVSYATFVRAEDAGRPFVPAEGRVATLFSSPLRPAISDRLGVELAPVSDTEEAVAALRDGDIDALIYPAETFEAHVAETGEQDRFVRLAEPEFRNDLAVALRPGLADLKRRLDVVIRGFLGSAEYRAIASQWFDPPVFWTEARISRLLYAVAVFLALILSAAVWINWRARRLSDRLRAASDAANARLSAILSSTSQAVFGFDPDGALVIANPVGRSLLGIDTLEQPLSWPQSARFVDPRTGERCRIFASDPGEDPPAHGRLCQFQVQDGEAPRFVRATVDTIDTPGTGLASLLIVEDDHENEITRQKLERSERLSSLGLLTGGLAHDFNNVLGTVLLNAEVGELKSGEAGRAFFTRIVEAVNSGKRLTNRLLSFSSQTPKAPVPVDVAASLARLEDLSQAAVTEAITLQMPRIDDRVFVSCDEGELENALLNLVLNARDAIRSSGIGDTIAVRVRSYDSDRFSETGPNERRIVEISVSDNGPGMSDEVKQRALDPFFTTRKDAGGTGLGLSMVLGFVQRAGGTLSLYSEPGKGTSIRLHLPSVTVAGKAEPRSDNALSRGHGERILVVEDRDALRTLTVDALSYLGYSVDSVANGVLALERLAEDADYALVLSDIVMPGGVSGFDLARRIGAEHPGVPVLLMTGYADSSAGSFDDTDVRVLQKPIPMAELAHAIAERARPAQATT